MIHSCVTPGGPGAGQAPPSEGSQQLQSRSDLLQATARVRVSADVRAIAVLLGLTLGFFAFYAVRGLTYYEDDIQNYYYPVLQRVLQSLRAGTLPFWAPDMFLGYPFFADGSAGTLYPLNWLALLVPAEQSITFLLALRAALSALFFYLFVRALGQSATAAVLASLAYAFSGYNVGHWIHLSLGHSTLTLPLALYAVEQAYRARGRRTVAWLLLATVATGLLWLGVHPQSALISSTCLGLYGLCRAFGRDSRGPLLRRPALTGGAAVALGLGAVGLAAAQLLPMLELATFAERGQGVSYQFASTYALPPHNLLTAIWPYLFVTPGYFDWGLTSRWECALYVGQIPLVLAAFALIRRRDRQVAFWGLLSLLGLWLAMAAYLPLNLHRLLFYLPGFSLFRAPGRFLELTDLALPVLAGYGLDLLAQPAARQALLVWARRLALVLVALVLLAVLGAALVLALPEFIPRTLWTLYLNWPHEAPWRAEEIWPALQQTLSFANPRFLLWSGLALLAAVLLLAWQRRPAWGQWRYVLVGCAALDLLLFAGHFWQAAPTELLSGKSGPVVEYLLQHGRGDRVWSEPRTTTHPNQLLGLGLDELNSYGAMEMHRTAEYQAIAERGDNPLFALLATRWVVEPLADNLPRQASGVGFDLRRPLIVVAPQQMVAPPVYTLTEPMPVQSVRIVGRLAHAEQVPQGQTVAEVILRGADGSTTTLPLQAGVHLAELDAWRADVQPGLRHSLPATALREDALDAAGRRFARLMYVADLSVPGGAVAVSQITVRSVDARTHIAVHGLALIAADGHLLTSDRLTDSRFTERARDATSRLLEAKVTESRVFLAEGSRVLPPRSSVLYAMAQEMVDPRQIVYLEEPAPSDLSGGDGPAGAARIVAEGEASLTVAVDANRPAYLVLADPNYPGWRAAVDGQPAPLYQADYVFRAVPVPEGRHEVTFVFAPESARLGFILSGVTLALLLLGAVACLTPRGRQRS